MYMYGIVYSICRYTVYIYKQLLLIYDTQSAQFSQKQDVHYIYIERERETDK